MWKNVDELLSQAVSSGLVPGCVFGAGYGSHILHTATCGNSTETIAEPVTPTTLYDVGALTQVLACMPLTLIAMEKGLLSLDDTLSRWLDNPPADKADITILQLLTHTSGMASRFLLYDADKGQQPPQELLLSHALAAVPGAKVIDSEMDYILLGFILEKALGMPFDKAFRSLVGNPLEMKSTCFLPSGGSIAPSYVSNDDEKYTLGIPHNRNARFLHGVAAHAGLFTNLTDMLAFSQMLANRGKTDRGVFLSERALHLACTDRTRNMNEARGYGFRITKRSDPFLGHFWPSGGYGLSDGEGGSIMAVNPEDGFYVVFLVNGADHSHVREEICRLQKLLLNAAYAAYQHSIPEG